MQRYVEGIEGQLYAALVRQVVGGAELRLGDCLQIALGIGHDGGDGTALLVGFAAHDDL